MKAPLARTRRWTRREYERLVEADILGPDDKIELLEGHLVVKEPQHGPHFTATRLVQEALRAAFGAGWEIRPQGPLALGRSSEPEPDVSVVRGSPRDFRDAHPMEAVWRSPRRVCVLIAAGRRACTPGPACPITGS